MPTKVSAPKATAPAVEEESAIISEAAPETKSAPNIAGLSNAECIKICCSIFRSNEDSALTCEALRDIFSGTGRDVQLIADVHEEA